MATMSSVANDVHDNLIFGSTVQVYYTGILYRYTIYINVVNTFMLNVFIFIDVLNFAKNVYFMMLPQGTLPHSYNKIRSKI